MASEKTLALAHNVNALSPADDLELAYGRFLADGEFNNSCQNNMLRSPEHEWMTPCRYV